MLRRHYPLRLHLATLFGVLVLCTGLLVGGYNQWVLRSQLQAHAEQQANVIGERTAEQLQALVRPLELALMVMGRGRQLEVPADLDETALRDSFRALLDHQAHLAAVFVGDAQGRFYILRTLNNEALRREQNAVPQARYFSQHITESGRSARFAMLAEDLSTLSTELRPDYAQRYDPRERPWYQQAQREGGVVRTPPYRFFLTQQLGMTLAWSSPDFPDVVLAVDLTLDTLQQTLLAQRLSAGHRLALQSLDGKLLASDDGKTTAADLQPASDRFVNRSDLGMGLQLISSIPEQELQAEARKAVQQSFIITLALLLVFLPLTLWLARRLARSLTELNHTAMAVKRFQFEDAAPPSSSISEVAELSQSIDSMRRTIRRFVNVTGALAEETDFERLQQQLLRLTLPAVEAAAGVLYLEHEGQLQARCAQRQDGHAQDTDLPNLQADCPLSLVAQALQQDITLGCALQPAELAPLGLQLLAQELHLGGAIAVPLHNRKRERIGMLLLLCESEPLPSRVAFAQAVANPAAMAIETRELIHAQRALFEAFIELIAAAIDAKSPYTGGHCERVPELTKALAQAAQDATDGPFASFRLSSEEWEALHVGAWLHDCGKVTMPDFVVDKATKLETLYNRIHEVRLRFELLKRDQELAHRERLLAGRGAEASRAQCDAQLARLDDEFAFVARCNIGGERLADADRHRLAQIGQQTWLRTLDDRLGLSSEERRRLKNSPAAALPQPEPLLADRPEHRVRRERDDPALQPSNRWGFQLEVPELLYNHGELYNLGVSRGTLSGEERFKINEHIVQTIVMLSKLPYPRHLRSVPEIAGGHHEKMDGSGYPKRLRKEEMSLPARMMAIADIFEALTAGDRPYKSAKPLSVALDIMAEMAATEHIDAELFALFVRSGVAQRYAQAHMEPQHVDLIDIEALLSRAQPVQ